MSADELPTSARLRQVEAERDEVRAAAGRTAEQLLYARTELGQVQRALAASQADLTAAKEQIKTLTEELAWQREVVGMLRKNEEIRARVIRERNAERTQLEQDLAEMREQRDAARAQLGFIVARDGGRHCELCEQEITRGQAYETTPGSTHLLLHVHCPDAKDMSTPVPMCTTDPTEES